MLTHANVAANALGVVAEFGMTEKDVWVFPLHFSFS